MKAKAISFTPEVLKAKMRALETYGHVETRRPLKHDGAAGVAVSSPEWEHASGRMWAGCNDQGTTIFAKAANAAGERVWVRERARVVAANAQDSELRVRYELDGEERVVEWPDRLVGAFVGHCLPNGVHREGARHFLEVTEVRLERLHDVTEADALLEGFETREEFKRAWNSIYAEKNLRWLEGAREISPRVFVYTLKKAAKP